MDILAMLADSARERYRTAKVTDIEEKAFQAVLPEPLFQMALAKPSLSIIAEVKRASPSKGLIAEEFDPLSIAREYESAQADAISVLTEPSRFLGSDEYLAQVSKAIALPTLRKDFIVNPYQILEARLLGASAVLLIAAILNDQQLKQYLGLTKQLGMDALVEVHDKTELERSIQAGSSIIGVNNRNLRTFEVYLETSFELRQYMPSTALCVSESGISGSDDAKLLAKAGFDAILVGELLMRSPDRKATIRELKG